MNILSRLVIKEIVPPMFVSLVIILFVFLMRTIAELAKSLIVNQYSLGEIGELLLYSIPPILGFVIPMSLLLGIILGLNRLSSDSEVIALLSGGTSAHALLMPVMLIAIIAWLTNTWLLTMVVPWANENYERIVFEHSSSVVNAEIKPRVFNENFPGFIIYVDDIEPDTGIWHKVFIFDKLDPENRKAIVANRGWLIESTTGSIDLQVEKFFSYTFPRAVTDKPTQVVQGGSTIFHLIEGEDLEARVANERKPQTKTVAELVQDINRNQDKLLFRTIARNEGRRARPVRFTLKPANGPPAEKIVEIPPTNAGDQALEIEFSAPAGYEAGPLILEIAARDQPVFTREIRIEEFQDNRENFFIGQVIEASDNISLLSNKLSRLRTSPNWVEIHKKFAIPFTCIIFAVLGMPLGLSSRRGGKAYGYITGILIFLTYWILLSTGDRMATAEKIDPALGIWIPNLLFGSLALLLIVRRRLEIRLPGLSRFLLRVRGHGDPAPDPIYENVTENSGHSPALQRPDEAPVHHGPGPRRRLLSLVDRYVLKTFLSMFGLVFIAMYAVFSLIQYIDQNYFIQKNNVDPAIIIDFFIYKAPDTIYWILPISTLMGTMICFGLLSKHQEITAFKSSGISIYRLAVPVLVAAIFIALIGFYNQDIIIPRTSTKLAEVLRIIRNGPVQTVSDPTNRWILSEDKESIYHFQKYDGNQRQISELQLFNFNPETNLMKSSLYSQQATWQRNGWVADRGWTVRYRGVSSLRGSLREGEKLPIKETPDYFGQEFRPADQMSFAELEAYILNLSTYGLATTAEEFQLSWKLAFPFLPIIMTILGLPFAFSSTRKSGGALTGIFISIGLVILYWGTMTMFKALGETGYLFALMAAWSPNIVFLGIGALLFAAVRS